MSRHDPRFTFVRSNFRYLYNFMRYYGESGEVDGLLADLGCLSPIISTIQGSRFLFPFRRGVGYADEYPCGADGRRYRE